jgi:hypothetical protein
VSSGRSERTTKRDHAAFAVPDGERRRDRRTAIFEAREVG